MSWSRARVCFEDTTTLADPNPTCPNAAAHTPSPVDYGGHLSWCRRMSRTHVQRRCPTCKLYVLWLPKITCSACGKLVAPTPNGRPWAHHTPQGDRCPC